MKALTCRHPWGFAICRLGKNIENRRWRPPTLPLTIALHGSVYPKGKIMREFISDYHFLKDQLGADLYKYAPLLSERQRVWLEGKTTLSPEEMITPGVVAVMTVSGVVTESTNPWFSGPLGWVLKDVRPLPEPIFCRGAQGLWTLPDDVEDQVRAQLHSKLEAA